jgi:hypothetical protein
VRACVGAIPYSTERCGPATEVVTPVPQPTTPEQIIRSVFGAAGSAAVSVARCESGLNPRAVSPSGTYRGLFQIGSFHAANFQSVTGQSYSAAVYDPYFNALYAKRLFDARGWQPWSCKPR